MQTKQKIFLDPPSGWMYGFPKEIDQEVYESEDFNLNTWLLDNGYPESELKFAMYTRTIRKEYEQNRET